MPVDLRYASALIATLRGSRLYGSSVNGSTIEKLMMSVFSTRKGSMYAVATSGINFMEPADRAAVEGLPDGEEVRVDGLGGHVEVLHDARQVAEANVNEFDVVLLDIGEDVVGGAEQTSLLLPDGGQADGVIPAAKVVPDPRGAGFLANHCLVSVVLRSQGPRPQGELRSDGP